VGSPTLHQLDVRSALLTDSPEHAVEGIFGESPGYAHEYSSARIPEQTAGTSGNYPEYYGVERGTACFLYMVVRNLKPSLTIELGVANGRSTQVILSALDANDKGRLVSVDIHADVGGAAVGHPRWDLRVHSPRSPRRQLRSLIEEVGAPDLFFHDALHSYHEQYADYLVAWNQMSPGSLLVSDDIDHSWAFLDLARRSSLRPVVLVDRRRAAGAIVRSS
jgi:predicted O-methyltransferase YrrM